MLDEPGRPSFFLHVRASDAEREAAVEQLWGRHHRRAAHLDRADRADGSPYTATTGGELARITAEPPAAAGSPASPVPATTGPDSGWVVALKGDTKRQGRWRVERPLAALAVVGLRGWLRHDDPHRRAIESRRRRWRTPGLPMGESGGPSAS
jgi:hypothetical protein